MGVDLQALGLVWLRVLAGAGLMTHGGAKVFGGGMASFTEAVAHLGFPLPALFAWAAALSELVGGLCLALGLGTRVAAGFITFTMSVAIFIQHAADPFHVKELAYLYWAISVALLLLGGGRYTLRRALTGQRGRRSLV